MITVRLFLLLGMLGLNACAGMPIYLHGSSVLNLDDNQHALPVRIKLYQLSAKQNFTHASFEDLWLRDKKNLAKTLIVKKAVTVTPASHKKIYWKVNKHARYIGVVALFRKPDLKHWSAIAQMSRSIKLWSGVKINLYHNRIAIQGAKLIGGRG